MMLARRDMSADVGGAELVNDAMQLSVELKLEMHSVREPDAPPRRYTKMPRRRIGFTPFPIGPAP